MAAILPPIVGQRTHVNQPPATEYVQQKSIPPIKGGVFKLQPVNKPQGKADRELMNKRVKLRAEQPLLTKTHTQKYRNTYIHNLSLDMLAAGFHLSFKELFSLINQQEADRQRAGPESVMWTQVMIIDEEEKLDMLQKYLTEAETAERKGEFEKVYNARYELAVYFEDSGDKWLSDHFYTTCLSTSTNVKSDGGRLQAEGERNVGLALEKSGRYFEAAEHFELYYNLSCNHDDWMKDDVTFHRDACINLYHINSVIGQELQDSDPEQSLEFLLKAFNKAKESCDRQLEGEAAYELGLAYERNGDGETALLHLNHFLETCKRAEDDEGIGRACDAIAKAYSRKGEVKESIHYLQQFVETAERSKKETELSKACHNLGNLYNKLGKYEEAAEYFSKAYNISRSLGETVSINTNRVQYGISMAHRMMAGFGAHLVDISQPSIERIVDWKSSRTDEFDKPFPEPSKSSAFFRSLDY
ncbi:hypothetical protein LOTGIDRAFT_125277 [Lottia gigantea]|uniref:Tetratricopeptide repeat protein 29 n=1 Tax=Lottia gigantea TaxID=225164 RepID=V4A836_LOTGI|nr:hypothetical protein LOTGIDRAFT_125277 [Lottia gigantea]ESO89436.1 hypothetical protein LOTGIDRAFT_125277 [Lottia gigantea]